ncbi:hypothetical protein PHYPO_G00092260 [Pangasianodon hypophthalmus]|uniref:Uncharacterized protein n=1 Tax=Pangasianodon hypophthalmus TaxID=310915 RepID=A0A5N5LAG2_PANHP|nr:hypothetical protein PHYPO_G00092260 [Pangasianodon hypophthalmus]
MEQHHSRADLNEKHILEQFKKNDETFRNTMERIFQKYSSLDDLGPDVCLKTMTFTSEKGSVPLDSATAEKELQKLRNQLKERPLQALDRPQEEHALLDQDASSSLSSCQMDVTMVDLDRSSQMENSNCSLWCGSETSQLSLKSVSSSRSCLWGEPSQPEEEDRDLERTLNSHGSTLLDVYPSMLNQIGEAYRRQHVTEVASAVLHRYRRRRWQSSQAQYRNHGFSNSSKHALNRTRESSLTAPKPPRDNITNHQKSKFKYQGSSPHKSNLDFSPLKSISNTSPVSTACFYSPRRDDVEKRTGVENGSLWTGQLSNSESSNRPVRVLDLSTPPSSVSSSPRSPSPDLNQTYIVQPVPLPRSHGIPASSVYGSTWSPLKMARISSLASQGGGPVNSSPSSYRSGLRRDHVNSPTASPQRALTGHLSQLRSPLKAKIISLEHDRQTSLSYPKQALPVIHTRGVPISLQRSAISLSPPASPSPSGESHQTAEASAILLQPLFPVLFHLPDAQQAD